MTYTRELPRLSKVRNKPCPCGSKIKFKKCCMKNSWPKVETNWPNINGNYVPKDQR